MPRRAMIIPRILPPGPISNLKQCANFAVSVHASLMQFAALRALHGRIFFLDFAQQVRCNLLQYIAQVKTFV
jgi:hypothetical protein